MALSRACPGAGSPNVRSPTWWAWWWPASAAYDGTRDATAHVPARPPHARAAAWAAPGYVWGPWDAAAHGSAAIIPITSRASRTSGACDSSTASAHGLPDALPSNALSSDAPSPYASSPYASAWSPLRPECAVAAPATTANVNVFAANASALTVSGSV